MRREFLNNWGKKKKRERDKSRIRADNVRTWSKYYGITEEQFEELQKGPCSLCKTTVAGGRGRFHVDHSHSTYIVRGSLCYRCNLSLGRLEYLIDNGLLATAINYLKK